MPQMAPYSWLNLYFMFTLIMVYSISYFYFISENKFNSKLMNLNKNNFSFKW